MYTVFQIYGTERATKNIKVNGPADALLESRVNALRRFIVQYRGAEEKLHARVPGTGQFRDNL